jgi:hypothetical protein
MDATDLAKELAALDESSRALRLREFEGVLASRFDEGLTREQFFATANRLVEELRALGHDIWSFDSDGETFEIWCGDYTKKGGGGPLSIEFRYPNKVGIEWRGREAVCR